MDRQTRRRVIAYCILFLSLILGVTIILLPYFQRFSEPAYQAEIQGWINNMGIVGLFVVSGVQVLQVIIAFIPGEPIEVLAGALYGTVGGLVICLVGCILASTIIFSLSKKFGKRLLHLLFSEDKIQNWGWLHESQKKDMVIFILFFIPGTPKDMLTYIVGMTEMSVGKFIGISTLARIPSVLSSTMIGATMRQGEWETSLIVFFITGIVGILGIGYKNKIIDFCHRLMKREYQENTKCECLDFVEAVYRNRVYPVMYCRMQIEGHLDGERLKNAVNLSSQYVPEVLHAYDFRHGYFVNQGLSADCAIVFTHQNIGFDLRWDLSKDTQIKIFLCQEELNTTITFGMSHILTDGEGFLQYLYLLSSLYDEKYPNSQIQNNRKISNILKDIHVQPPTEQTKNGKKFSGFMMSKVNIITNMTEFLSDDSSMKTGLDIMEEEFPESSIENTISVMFTGLPEDKKEVLKLELSNIQYVETVNYEAEDAHYNKYNYTLYVLNIPYDYSSIEMNSVEKAVKDSYSDQYDMIYSVDDANGSGLPLWILGIALVLLMVILFIMCNSWVEPFLFLITIGVIYGLFHYLDESLSSGIKVK